MTLARENADIHDGSTNITALGTVTAGNLSNVAIVYPVGHTVQLKNVSTVVQNTGTTNIPLDDTIPQNSEGDEKMTLAFTPKSASNKLLINVVVHGASSEANQYLTVALFQDTTASAIAASVTHTSTGDQRVVSLPLSHYMTAGTASATTFKIRIGCTGGTTTFNGASSTRFFGGVLTSSMTITEIQA